MIFANCLNPNCLKSATNRIKNNDFFFLKLIGKMLPGMSPIDSLSANSEFSEDCDDLCKQFESKLFETSNK